MTLRRPWLILLFALAVAGSAFAQSATTATLRGKITNAKGNAVANAEINAVETSTGFVHTVNSRPDGTYTLAGLSPGLYNIVVAAPGYSPKSQDITVLIGQVLDLNIGMDTTATLSESITVVGTQAVETRTSEIATNVTTQQIETLPQPERNFLNFAAMAPGVRLSNDPQRKTFAGDAQPAEATNVFIDGVSTKNDVLQGGISGQDSSRGNPFPQNALQEFRVITQNYSAQYDKASSAIITAVTKSGGNAFTGQAFVFYQPRNWVAKTTKNFQFSTLATNVEYRRYQPGISFGGPIITASGIIFIGGTYDPYLRAFDVDTGRELWKGELPASGHAMPITYQLRSNGKQYVVIAAGGHAKISEERLGDALVAFALDR